MNWPPAEVRSAQRAEAACFALQFRSFASATEDLCFPCNANGVVDLNALTPQELKNYLYARALVGRSFSPPQRVECAEQ